MSERDVTTLARTVFQTLIDVVYIISNVEFQRSVWMLGNHPKRYVNSYDETVEMFEENLKWLLDDDLWRCVPLKVDQATALRELFAEIEAFDHGSKRGCDPSAIINDPAWVHIISRARQALAKILDNAQGISPSIA